MEGAPPRRLPDRGPAPVYGAHNRLARRHMQTVASTYRALDGPNGLRSRRVWLRGLFDRAMADHQPPRPWAPTLAPDELAEL